VAVGAVVFKDNQVLLVRRGKAPSKGLWAIPGGSVDLGETLQAAAEREIFEETGIDSFDDIMVIGYDTWVTRKKNIPVCGIVSLIKSEKDEIILSQEHKQAKWARWISPEDLKDLAVNERTRNLLMQRFDFGGPAHGSAPEPIPPTN